MKPPPKIILVFAAVDWDIYMRKPMVYALAEAAKAHGSTVIAVNRPICLQTTWFAKPKRIPDMFRQARLETLADNLYLYHPRYYVHDRIANAVPLFERINLFALRQSYAHLQNVLNIAEPAPLLWFHYPHQGYVARLFDDSLNILEIYDNLTDIDGNELDYVNRLERRHRRRVDILLTTSKKIHDKYARGYRRSYMFGNGLSRSVYERLTDPNIAPRPELAAIPSPRLGYAGMISDRMDWNLITELAADNPSWNFIFAGPAADKKLSKRVSVIANIHLPGAYPREDIPSVLKSFDIGLLPYRDNPFFEFLNPLKFYEMAAAGIPMLSSPIDELRQFPDDLVRVIDDNRAEAWSDTIGSMVNAGRAAPRKIGPRVAADYIWEDMTAALLQKIVDGEL